MPVTAGTRIGRYEVLELIGSGGMGEVYRARDDRLQREVALKILPEQGDNTVASRRFATEARAIAALAHPNIINIFDFGTEGARAYIAMELLRGETLRSMLARGAVTPKKAVKIGEAVAEALRAAHDKGIAHRDLKPENIFIGRDGSVKVLDFGLARIVTASPASETGITREGTVMGTVDYMSPEQVRGEPAGPSSDLFSLGCVLFEMLGRAKPFARASTAETTAAILRDDPPDLHLMRPELPEPLIRLVNRCLEKDPAHRFQSAADLAFALDAVADSTTAPPPLLERLSRQRRSTWVLPVILLALIAVVVVLGRNQSGSGTAAAPARVKSIAVLPFINATGDPSLEYLSDGITEGIINDLSPVTRVPARNSVFLYKGKNPDARDVGRKLDVDVVVTGRLVQHAGSIQARVELADARDGHQIWGDKFERPMSDIAILESELSRTISQQLQMTLTGADQSRIDKRAAVNPEAYRLYLQGRYEWRKRTPEGLKKGIEFFRRSIDIDPTYAPAHAGIADSYLLLGGNYELMPPREAMPMARQAARRALELDDKLAEAHASLGVIDHEFEWNWTKAEADFKRAIELNPNYPGARQWYGHALIYRSRFDEGLQQLRKAEELDPLSWLAKSDLSQALWIARRYDEAIAEAQSVIEIEPQFWLAYWFLGLAQIGKGELNEAATALERGVQLGGTPATMGTLGYVYARMGRLADAERIIRELESLRKKRYVSPAAFAPIYIGMNDLDRAFAELEKGFRERASLITVLNVVPIADPIRRDPRYIPFARRVGLPPVP